MKESLVKKIEGLVIQEVERRLDTKLTNFVSYISKRFAIDPETIINAVSDWKHGEQEDASGLEGMAILCRGHGATGKRCRNTAKYHGYCWRHRDQYRPVVKTQPEVNNEVHNHDTSVMLYSDNCPVCRKGIDDMNNIEMEINI